MLWPVKPTWAHRGSACVCVWEMDHKRTHLSCPQLSQHRTIFQVSISHKEFHIQAIIHGVSTSGGCVTLEICSMFLSFILYFVIQFLFSDYTPL